MATNTTLTRDLEAEQNALADALKSTSEGGANTGISTDTQDVADLSAATQQLLQEQVNMRVYGTANPTFTEETSTSTSGQSNQASSTTAEDVAVDERPILDVTSSTTTEGTTDTTGTTNQFADDLSALEQPSLTDIRDEQIARAQSLIDATEALFLADVAELQQQGAEALARTSSIHVGAGLAGSPFQLTAESKTQGFTQAQVTARRNERAAEISAAMAQAEGRADAAFQQEMSNFRAERDFLVSERDKQIQEDTFRADAAKSAAFETIASLADAGFSLDEMDPIEYSDLLANAGISDFEAKARWAANTPQANAQYEIQNGQIVGFYFDPITGKPTVTTTPLPPELIEQQAAQVADVQTLTDARGNIYWYDANNPTHADGSLRTFQVGEGAITGSDDELISLEDAAKYGLPTNTTQGDLRNLGFIPTEVGSQEVENIPTLTGSDLVKATQTKKLQGIVRLNDAIGNYKALIEEHGSASGFSRNDRDLLDAAFEQITFAIKDAEDLGALQAPDIEAIQRLIPDVTVEGLRSLIPTPFKAGRAINSLDQTTESYAQISENLFSQLIAQGASVEDPIMQNIASQLNIDTSSMQPEGSNLDFDLNTPEGIDSFLDSFSPDLSASVNGSGAEQILGLGKITAYGSPLWGAGLDIDLKIGDPVANAEPGRVVFAGTRGGFGNQVRVETASGDTYWYSHLDSINVREGQRIPAGFVVGAGGNTGSVIPMNNGDGSHLDLTVSRSDGSLYTPRQVEQKLLGLV